MQEGPELVASESGKQLSDEHEGVDVAYEGNVAALTFWEGSQNYLSLALLTRIADTLEDLDREDQCRCVVLRSRGRVFCAGAKLDQPAVQAAHAEQRDHDGGEDPYYVQAVRLFSTHKPIVASVQGAAVGAGLGLALAADFRVCSTAARFVANFVALGFHPGFGITAVLPRIVGPQNAALMLLTGRRVKPEEARDTGLVDVLAQDDRLSEETMALAAEIAVNAPLALEETRATLRADLAELVRRQTVLESARQHKLAATSDFAEGLKAVRERRPGQFQRK